MLNSPRKFSIASSVASPSSSIYYTPTEYPIPPTITGKSSCPTPRLSVHTKGRSKSVSTPSKETLIVPEQKPLTASTLSLAGSYGVSNDGEPEERETIKKIEDLESKWFDENNNDLPLKSKSGYPLTLSSLTPLERVAIKGFASQRRKNSKFIKNPSRKSIYHNLIPEIYIHDTDLYKQSQQTGPVFEQFINTDGRINAGFNADTNDQEDGYKKPDPSTHDDIEIPEEQNDPSSFYAGIETYTDYVIPKRRKSKIPGRKPTPKMRMGMSPVALQRLFNTPHRKSVGKVKSPVVEVHWGEADTEYPPQYRSVLTGEPVQPVTPNCSIFHGKAMTSTAKVFRTLCLAYAYFVVGMCFSLLGPTLLEFTEHSKDTTREQAYQFLTVRGAGVALGSVLLGTVIHVLDNYVSFAIVLTLCGAANIGFPMFNSFLFLILDEFFIGVCLGFLDTGTQILCVDIWGYDNAPYMLSIHFVYGMGTVAGPLIAQPFLREEVKIPILPEGNISFNNIVPYSIMKNESYPNTFTIIPDSNPSKDPNNISLEYNYMYAYFIVGALFVSCGVLKMIIWMSSGKCRCKTNSDVYIKKSRRKSPGQSSRICLYLLTVVFMMLHLGIESSYKGLLAPYTVEVLKWTKSFGAWITALVYTTYSLGRGIGIAMGKCLEPGILLWLNLLLMFTASLLELLMISKYPMIIWISAGIQGLGQSTVLPACFMWVTRRLQLQGITAGILMFTSSLGMVLLPGITGWITTSYTPKAFNIVPMATISFNMILFCIMYCLGQKIYKEYGFTDDVLEDRKHHLSKYEDILDENANFKETTTSTRLSECEKEQSTLPTKIIDDDTTLSPTTNENLKTHHEYTGSPKIYMVNNTSFGSDVISEIKSQSEEGSAKSVRNRSPCPEGKIPASLLKSPYSMNSYTPLALVTWK